MPHRDTALVKELWQQQPDIDPLPVYQWIDLMYQPDHAFRIAYAFRDWLPTTRATQPPNLVEYIAIYGYIRLRLKTWKLPISLTPPEMGRWQAAGYYVTKEDFYVPITQMAGGFLKLAGTDSQLTAAIIRHQLDEKLAELERLASLPLADYTPEYQEWQIRERFVAQGMTGDDLEVSVADEVSDEMHDNELDRFKKPFTLRQQLESFEWGMECLRLIVMGEHAPDLNLPNKELFDALMQIDLNGLIAQLKKVDVRLRAIWRNLEKYKCYCLNAGYEPQRFWWRHWKASPAKAKK